MRPESLHILFAVVAVFTLVWLIARWRVHAFLALTFTAITLGLACGIAPDKVVASFEKGFGDVAGHVGIIVALGVILGGLLISSGGADLLASSLIRLGGVRFMPWTMCLAALLIGLPLFFEVSLVLLAPVCFALTRQLGVHPLKLGIPMMAGIIGAHGLLPPHPAPTIAVLAFHADAGRTILFGLAVAVPALAISGPLWGTLYFRWFAPVGAGSDRLVPSMGVNHSVTATPAIVRQPRLSYVVMAILLPPVLMLVRSGGQLVLTAGSLLLKVLNFVGDPVIALLAAVLFAMIALGVMLGLRSAALRTLADGNLAGAAAIFLVTGAGGGLKQILIDTRIGDSMIAWAREANFAPLILAWSSAALLRITIGTSTVSTIMASGLIAPMVLRDPAINRELMVLATGCGSIFGSHLNDPGFWFIKQYFNLGLAETFRTWTVLTVLLSLTGLGIILLLGQWL